MAAPRTNARMKSKPSRIPRRAVLIILAATLSSAARVSHLLVRRSRGVKPTAVRERLVILRTSFIPVELRMIIDCHGHYTTAPKALGDYRDRQKADLKKNPQHQAEK